MPQSAVCGIYAFTEASGKAPVNTQCPQKPAEGIVSFTENNLPNQKSFPHIQELLLPLTYYLHDSADLNEISLNMSI